MGGRGAGLGVSAKRERERNGLTNAQHIKNDANQRTNTLNEARDRGAATVSYRNVFGVLEFYYWDGARYTKQPVSRETQQRSGMHGLFEAEYDASRFIEVNRELGRRGRRR